MTRTYSLRELLAICALVLIAAILISELLGTIPGAGQSPGASRPSAATTAAPTSRTLGSTAEWGITTDPDQPLARSVPADAALVHRPVAVLNRFISWDLSAAGQKSVIDELRRESTAERTIMITWEPGAQGETAAQLKRGTTLAKIASGSEDAEARAFLAQLTDFRGPVALRFAHEMNGTWYPWAGSPALYLRAWAHIRALVQQVSPEVKMVWSVNSEDVPKGNSMESYWPGSDQVDVIGIDGYNCLRGWQSPEEVFASVYARAAALDPKLPIWLTEVASCEPSAKIAGSTGQSKAAWIQQLLDTTAMPRVAAIVWFDRNKEYDWRVNSSKSATLALVKGLAR